MKNIAVFFGGVSVEHDVSVITGVLTVNALKRTGNFNVFPVYVDKSGEFFTGEELNDVENYGKNNFKKIKRVTILPAVPSLFEVKGKKLKEICVLSAAVNCMHGGAGESGALSGLLTLSGIPFASPDLLASSVSMDKYAAKIFLKGLKVKTLKGKRVSDVSQTEKLPFPYPVVVKPCDTGSSIGITVANNKKELIKGVNYALRFSSFALIEEFAVSAVEVNCAAYMDGEGKVVVSECEKPVLKGEILSFDDKYKKGEREFPADIDKKFSDEIKKTTEKVYLALNCSGVIRIDYFIYKDKVYLNEINSVPGSLSYYLFGDTLKSFAKILKETFTEAEKRFSQKSSLKKSFETSVLNLKGAKGQKRL